MAKLEIEVDDDQMDSFILRDLKSTLESLKELIIDDKYMSEEARLDTQYDINCLEVVIKLYGG